MNDRSRGAAAASALADAGEAPRVSGRDPWFGRLLQRLHLRSRDSVRDELEAALAAPPIGEHPLSPQERGMLKNVLGLHRLEVHDVMVPRSGILGVSETSSLAELLVSFRAAGHSRLPVYGESLDDAKGMVHIRDVVEHIASHLPALGSVDLSASLLEAGLVRSLLFVPPSMPAMDLLVRMQATRTHMALVIDEHGGTDGLISIEDLVEMIVGDIEDEHDEETGALVTQDGDGGGFVADARAALDDVSRIAGVDLGAALGPEAEEVGTIGGFVVTLAGRVPSQGERIAGPGDIEVEVLDADTRRVKRVRLSLRVAADDLDAVPAERSLPRTDAAQAVGAPQG